jgi:hypothetical protein
MTLMATQLRLLDPDDCRRPARPAPSPVPPADAACPVAVPVRRPSAQSADWYLDEHTREVGRRGVEAARQALAAAAGRLAAA